MSIIQRYLVYLKYIGSGFRGSQIQSDVITVQGAVKNAVETLPNFKKNYSSTICFSSRTDSGVHATVSAFHFDMPIENALSPQIITKYLNKNFRKNSYLLIATEVLKVSDKFNARFSALEKTYLYRIGVRKKPFSKPKFILPLPEMQRTYFIRNDTFDFDKAKEASDLFIGEKNFKAFEGKASESICHPICKINSFSIQKSQPFCLEIDPYSQMFDYYSFTCSGNRFLRYMVRRMVGTVVAAAVNIITLDEVKLLLEKPEPSSLFSKISVPPGFALYLIKLHFNQDHLFISEEEKLNKLGQHYNSLTSELKQSQPDVDLIENSGSV